MAGKHINDVELASGDEGPAQVPCHRGVVRAAAGLRTRSGTLEGAEWVGDVVGSEELEWGSKRIPKGKPDHAPDSAAAKVVHRRMVATCALSQVANHKALVA
jgi:hypothetical protein